MIRTWLRRVDLAVGTAAHHMIDSRYIIWCFALEHMPATIDLLIARGSLREADRPHCVHWTAAGAPGRRSPEDVGKTVDAEEMLSKAGIRTLMVEAWEALMQGAQQLKAFFRDRIGAPEPEAAAAADRLDAAAASLRERHAVARVPFHDDDAAPEPYPAD